MVWSTGRMLGVVGALLLVVLAVGLWKEESFTLVQDVKGAQHHEFEPNEEQKAQLENLDTQVSPAPSARVAPAPQRADLAEADGAALSKAEAEALFPHAPKAEAAAAASSGSSPSYFPATAAVLAASAVASAPVDLPPPVQESADAALPETPPPGAVTVKPPESKVPNCATCPPVEVPKQCGWLNPVKGATGKRRLQQLDPGGGGVGGSGGGGPRRGLLAKVRTAFQSADRKVLAQSRQVNFKPPSAAMQADIRSSIMAWKQGPACGFWTRACVQRYLRNSTEDAATDLLQVRRGPRNVFKDKQFPEGGEQFFPDLQRGELGSCAVVAVSDRMLGKKRGVEIDQHDTVFRYNGSAFNLALLRMKTPGVVTMQHTLRHRGFASSYCAGDGRMTTHCGRPMKAYARDVGTKGDIFYWKQRRDEKQYGVEGQRANKFYMWKDPSKYYMFADAKEWPSMTFHGKQMLWETGLFVRTVGEIYGRWCKEQGEASKHAASGGFGLAMAVISSGLCERVDLYGYSAEGGGRYFKNAVVNQVHIIGLEHWTYRQAMEAGYGVCVYD